MQISQLLFDFGQTLAATEAARKLAEVAAESVELQRQLSSLAIKDAYTNMLFARRHVGPPAARDQGRDGDEDRGDDELDEQDLGEHRSATLARPIV